MKELYISLELTISYHCLSLSVSENVPAKQCSRLSGVTSGLLLTWHCVWFYFYAFVTRQCQRRLYVFWLSVCHVRSSICLDRFCYHDISWMAGAISMKCTGYIH